MGGPPGDYPVNAVVALVKSETVADALRVVGQVQAAESVRLVSEVDATLETRWRRVIESIGINQDWLDDKP